MVIGARNPHGPRRLCPRRDQELRPLVLRDQLVRTVESVLSLLGRTKRRSHGYLQRWKTPRWDYSGPSVTCRSGLTRYLTFPTSPSEPSNPTFPSFPYAPPRISVVGAARRVGRGYSRVQSYIRPSLRIVSLLQVAAAAGRSLTVAEHYHEVQQKDSDDVGRRHSPDRCR